MRHRQSASLQHGFTGTDSMVGTVVVTVAVATVCCFIAVSDCVVLGGSSVVTELILVFCCHLCVPAEHLDSSVRSLLLQRLHGGVVVLHPCQLVSVSSQELLLMARTRDLHQQLLDVTVI